MKTSFAAIATLFLGASMVSAALEPRATMAAQHNKRGSSDEVFNLSAILADPSSYLASASKAFKNPKYASEFAKATANPKFEKSLSKDLVSQFGSKTASIALQQYTAILGKVDKVATSTAADGSAATATGGSIGSEVESLAAGVLGSSSATATNSVGTNNILGSQTSGSTSTLISITLLGSAISLGAVVVLAAL